MTFKFPLTLLAAPIAALVLASPVHSADPEAGKQAYQSCVSCHGDQAQGNDALGAPALAGQQAAYIVRQIDHFQTGLRGREDAFAAQMPEMVKDMDKDAIANVAAYVSSLAPAKTEMAEGDLRQGNNYYHGSCGGCHGGKAEGNELLNAPRLAGLSPAYLKRQFEHFKSGTRGSDALDRFGRQMKMMAQVLPDDATRDAVIAYITAQAQ
jgi:cytochrome c oxidase subunit 2